MSRSLLIAALLVLASCATPTAAERLANSQCGDLRIKGTPDAFTLSGASLGDASVAAPEWCEAGMSHYILITREEGSRPIVNDRSSPDPCAGEAGESEACQNIQITPLLRMILERTQAAGIEGAGGGPDDCTDLNDPVAQWRWSIGVNDWADADATARIVADVLRSEDIEGSLAVSVEPRECYTIE